MNKNKDKKKYKKPEISVYGSVCVITQASKSKGDNDAGKDGKINMSNTA